MDSFRSSRLIVSPFTKTFLSCASLHRSALGSRPLLSLPMMNGPSSSSFLQDHDEGEWQTVTTSKSKIHRQPVAKANHHHHYHHQSNHPSKHHNQHGSTVNHARQQYQHHHSPLGNTRYSASSSVQSQNRNQYQQFVSSRNTAADNIIDPEVLTYYRDYTLSILNQHQYYSPLSKSKLMILLCGIPGCGKSTFSRKLMHNMPEEMRANWLHLNQDELKSRHAVIDRTLEGLQQQKHIIIDRCNFDITQRSHWIELAQQCSSYTILCVLMPNFLDVEVCVERAFIRGDSDGIHDSDTNWFMVCNRMKSDFVFPTHEEGIHCIYPCDNNDDIDRLMFSICGESRPHVATASIIDEDLDEQVFQQTI